MTEFQDLPQELRMLIGQFLPIWERWGLRWPLGFPPIKDPRAYYTVVRRKPKAVKWNGSTQFYYRRCRHFFQWTLFLDYPMETKDFWVMEMRRQWGDHGLVLDPVMRSDFHTKVGLPPILKLIRVSRHRSLRLEFEASRPDGLLPTRQACAEALCHHMVLLAKEAEVLRRQPTTKPH